MTEPDEALLFSRERPMQKVCRCRRGYASAYDGKCGYCRSKRERKEHRWLLWAAERERARYAAIAREAVLDQLTSEAQAEARALLKEPDEPTAEDAYGWGCQGWGDPR